MGESRARWVLAAGVLRQSGGPSNVCQLLGRCLAPGHRCADISVQGKPHSAVDVHLSSCECTWRESQGVTLLPVGDSGGVATLYRVSRGTDVDGSASLATEASLCAHPGLPSLPCTHVTSVKRLQCICRPLRQHLICPWPWRCAEEVYACEFLEAMDGRLCTASDTSLFLWDLAAAALVQRCGPPGVPADKRSGGAPWPNAVPANATGCLQLFLAIWPEHLAFGSTSTEYTIVTGPEHCAISSAHKGKCAFAAAMPERWRPGYVFSLSQQPDGGGLLAGTCSDGAVSHCPLPLHFIDRLGPACTVR